jgi:hypothetical protein
LLSSSSLPLLLSLAPLESLPALLCVGFMVG